MDPQPELMDTKEVAELLAVTPRTVMEWAKSGKLRGIKFNNDRWRFWRDDVMAALGDGPAKP